MAVEVKNKLVTVEDLGLVFGKDSEGNDIATTYVKTSNLTPASIGAVNKSGDSMTGNLYVNGQIGVSDARSTLINLRGMRSRGDGLVYDEARGMYNDSWSDIAELANAIQTAAIQVGPYGSRPIVFYVNFDYPAFGAQAVFGGMLHSFSADGLYFTAIVSNISGRFVRISRAGESGLVTFEALNIQAVST